MKNIVIVVAKYLIILLMAFYTYESYQAIRQKEKQKIRQYCFKQSFLFYIIHALCYVVIYMHTLQDKIVIFYGAQLLYFILLIEINKMMYKKYNRQLLNVMSMMLMTGFVILTRISYDKAKKQFIMCVAATVLAMFIPFIMKKIKTLRDFSVLYAVLGIAALMVVYVTGKVTYGAKLSLDLGFITIQPSEFVKISYVMFVGGILYRAQNCRNILISAFLAAIHIILLVLSSDLGTALILSIVYIFILFMSTGRMIFLFGGLVAGSTAAAIAYKFFYHVQVRVAAWVDPWSIIENKGYQIAQSLFAIGTGGLLGLGLYEGMPDSIPVVDQDFIFSAISEEFGAIFAICIIILSLNIFLIFIRTAFNSIDGFYKLVCAGFAVLYGFQLFLTVGGAIKLIPSTGVTYPLISYGGSSLVSTIFIFFIVQGVKINENEQ